MWLVPIQNAQRLEYVAWVRGRPEPDQEVL